MHRGLGVEGVGLAVHRRAWGQRQIWLAIYRWVWGQIWPAVYRWVAEADLASCLQTGVELCMVEADLACCAQKGVKPYPGRYTFRFLPKEKPADTELHYPANFPGKRLTHSVGCLMCPCLQTLVFYNNNKKKKKFSVVIKIKRLNNE